MDLEQYINLCQYASDRDMDAILKVVPDYRDTNIDIISALQTLQQREMITKLQSEKLVGKFACLDDKNRFSIFILDIFQLVSFRELIQFLHLINCKTLAEELEVERYHRQMYLIEGSDFPNGCRIVKFYSKMKSYCDDNVPYDRPSALLRFSTDLEQKMPNIMNIQDRQWAADRYATLIQLRAKYCTRSITIETILQRMQNNMPEGVDTLYADILYHCNFGLFFAKSGNELSARNHIRQVYVSGSTCRLPFIRVFSYYHAQYIYRCLYSQNPSPENLMNALLHCDLGLNVLTDMNQTDIQLIRRILLLNKIQTLLEIRNDFSVNLLIPIKDSHLFAAEELLRTVEENFSKIECRREMIYSLCKARTLQDQDLHSAMAYLDRALVKAKEGAYFKSNILNIAAYQNWLLLRELPCDW